MAHYAKQLTLASYTICFYYDIILIILYFFSKIVGPYFVCKLSMAIYHKMAMDNFHTTLFLSGQIWSKCQNKFGRARPGPAGPALTKGLRMRIGADLHENQLFIEKRSFRSFLVISGPSRPQKWIRLEISGRMVLSGGLETQNKCISWQIYLRVSILA